MTDAQIDILLKSMGLNHVTEARPATFVSLATLRQFARYCYTDGRTDGIATRKYRLTEQPERNDK